MELINQRTNRWSEGVKDRGDIEREWGDGGVQDGVLNNVLEPGVTY